MGITITGNGQAVKVSGFTSPPPEADPIIEGNAAAVKEAPMRQVQVEALRTHADGSRVYRGPRTADGPGDRYFLSEPRANEKVRAGVVKLVGSGSKSAGPTTNKAEAPTADKSLDPWPLQTPPEDYIAKHEGEKDLSDAVTERLKLARAHVKAAK